MKNKDTPSEYSSWSGLKSRCLNKKSKKYPIYGGRGIKVCERWLKFESFLEDMGKKPSPRYSIERIDNNGNYEPSNCKWATVTEQANNKRCVRKITFNGETLTFPQWGKKLGINYKTLKARIDNFGYSIEKAFSVELYEARPTDVYRNRVTNIYIETAYGTMILKDACEKYRIKPKTVSALACRHKVLHQDIFNEQVLKNGTW